MTLVEAPFCRVPEPEAPTPPLAEITLHRTRPPRAVSVIAQDEPPSGMVHPLTASVPLTGWVGRLVGRGERVDGRGSGDDGVGLAEGVVGVTVGVASGLSLGSSLSLGESEALSDGSAAADVGSA